MTKASGLNLICWNGLRIIPLWLSCGVECNHFYVQRAAEVTSYIFLDRLITTDLSWLPENAHRAAALSGNLDMMFILVESEDRFSDSRSFAVAEDRKTVEWLRELRLHDDYAFVQAARGDDVCVIKQRKFS